MPGNARRSWLHPLGVLLWLLASGAALPLAAQPLAERASIAGSWIVGYEDRALGTVQGRAFIYENEQEAVVELTDPRTGARHEMRSTRFVRSGNELELTLRGSQPSADLPFDPLGDDVVLAPGAPSTRLSLGDGEHEVPIEHPELPEEEVRLTLRYDGREVLAGEWRQQVDAVSGRSAGGQERRGLFDFDFAGEGTTGYLGIETWRRPRSVIKAVFTIEEQFQIDELFGPDFPYPFANGSDQPRDEHLARRTLFVLGKELPRAYREPVELESLDEGVRYSLRALEPDFADPGHISAVEKGWDKLRGIGDGAPPVEIEPDDDVVLIRVDLEPGVRPGIKDFRLNGAEAAWLLRFGDHIADFTIARDIGHEQTEATGFVLEPETVFAEVRARGSLPWDEIPLHIAINGQIQLWNGQRTVLATRTEPGSRVYRTPPLVVAGRQDPGRYPAGSLLLAAGPGDSLQVGLAGPAVVHLAPAIARAEVLAEPIDVGRAVAAGPEGGASAGLDGAGAADPRRHLRWSEAVLTAARCAGVEDADAISDPEALTGEKAESFTNVIISKIFTSSPSLLTTKVKVGEHAAALMFYDMLRYLLEGEAKAHEQSLSDEQIVALRRELEKHFSKLHRNTLPINTVEIPAPDGTETRLGASFDPEHLEATYGLRGRALEAYQITAMRAARVEFARAIRASQELLVDTDLCEVEDLLHITGVAMEPVEPFVRATLMELGETNATVDDGQGGSRPVRQLTWVANRQARAWLVALRETAKTLRHQQELGRADTQEFLLAASIVSLPFGFVSRPMFLLATLLVDVTDLAVTLGTEISLQLREEDELVFAQGASAVIGTRRYQRAEIEDTPWFSSAARVLVSVVGIGPAVTTYKALVRTRAYAASVKRGQTLARSAREDPAGVIARLDVDQKRDLFRAIVEARKKRLGKNKPELEPGEIDAFELSKVLDRTHLSALRLDKPDWAAGLSDRAYQRLDDMVARADIARLVENHPGTMERLLFDPDALTVLRLPQEDLASLERAVDRVKRRAPTRGGEFVGQTRFERGDPAGLHFEEPKFFNEGAGRFVEFRVYSGRDGTGEGLLVGHVKRGEELDIVFGTGKKAIVFDLIQTFRQVRARSREVLPGLPRPTTGPAPRWITDVPVPLRDEAPGIPFVMYCNLRAYTALGFDFADPTVGSIVLRNIQSANTAIEFDWLRLTYPAKSPEELFRYTRHYRYAENTAQQMGFRITEVRLSGIDKASGNVRLQRPSEELVNGWWFDPGRAENAAELQAARDRFLELYDPERQLQPVVGFDAQLKLEPLE